MTCKRPEINETDKFPLSVAAKVLEINSSTAWRWVQRGWLKARQGRRKQTMFCTGKDILDAWALNL